MQRASGSARDRGTCKCALGSYFLSDRVDRTLILTFRRCDKYETKLSDWAFPEHAIQERAAPTLFQVETEIFRVEAEKSVAAPLHSREHGMLKLRRGPDLTNSTVLARLGHRIYVPWQASIEGTDIAVDVLVEVEPLVGEMVFTEQIDAALARNRQRIEQIANSLYRPGDERVFVEAAQLRSPEQQCCTV
jgi:hypothetical protein